MVLVCATIGLALRLGIIAKTEQNYSQDHQSSANLTKPMQSLPNQRQQVANQYQQVAHLYQIVDIHSIK